MNSLRELQYKLKARIRSWYYKRNMYSIHYEQYIKRYRSYRYAQSANLHPVNHDNFITAVPNPGAGIGHQMANWMAGYYAAKYFGLKFVHIPFSRNKNPLVANHWDSFLGFGEGEQLFQNVIKEGYKVVRLPLFNFEKPEQVNIINKIISAYSNKQVIFLCEQDQFLKNLDLLIPDVQQKFYASPARNNDKLVYDKNNFNIAIHVRRGDIMADSSNEGLTKRILSNDYFHNVLKSSMQIVKTDKPIHVYFFSQGVPADYPEFEDIPNLHWCMDMSAQDSFLHMVYADILITSKSSFSYKPALLNRGIKICPKDFWHGYPDANDWLLTDNNGDILK